MDKLAYNCLDSLFDLRASHEGILSTSLAPSGNFDYSLLLERLDCLVRGGLSQLLELVADPNVFTGTDIALAETQLVLEGTQHGAHREMFFDTAAVIRKHYPQLPLIASSGIMNVMSYGQKRFIQKCVEYRIDGIDFPRYLVIEDPIDFRQDIHNAGMYLICPIYMDRFRLDSPEQMALLEKVVALSKGQLFLVPGASGSTNHFDGRKFRPLIELIHEFQEKHGIRATIICIGGITNPDNVYELVQVAGADGIHYSSACINRLLSGMPLEQIEHWLLESKSAMRG